MGIVDKLRLESELSNIIDDLGLGESERFEKVKKLLDSYTTDIRGKNMSFDSEYDDAIADQIGWYLRRAVSGELSDKDKFTSRCVVIMSLISSMGYDVSIGMIETPHDDNVIFRVTENGKSIKYRFNRLSVIDGGAVSMWRKDMSNDLTDDKMVFQWPIKSFDNQDILTLVSDVLNKWGDV